VHHVTDGLDEAAQTLEFLAEGPRPNLSAVILLSSWPGRSRRLPNAGALPVPHQAVLLELLQTICDLDDEMSAPVAGTLPVDDDEHD